MSDPATRPERSPPCATPAPPHGKAPWRHIEVTIALGIPGVVLIRLRLAAVTRSGVDVIDLGVGDPDLPTPAHIVNALCDAARDPRNHHYPSYAGMEPFRTAVADWYRSRFSVTLDPGKEVLALMGSKDGIAHIPEAFINPGDYVLAPSPGYPVYRTSTLFAEGKVYEMPLIAENRFLPDLSAIPKKVAKAARLMFLNYPNNPTSAVTQPGFFEEAVDFALDHDILIVHENAYSEISFDGYRAPSFLSIIGAMENSEMPNVFLTGAGHDSQIAAPPSHRVRLKT